ncbi:MAG: 1,4-alpha-glucan branching protein domain-containing protein [Treponemataceae bacterium]
MHTIPAVALVLHAHLPFVRHPEYPRFLEERWLFEAISETYLPLLRVFDRLEADKVPFRLAMSFSPTLCEMLSDPLLRERYVEHLDRLIELGLRETIRTENDPKVNRLARFYYDRAVEDRVLFTERYEKDLLKAFDFYHKKGRLELLTTAATHAFLPFLASSPEALQAQIEVALSTHRSHFGKNPAGFWLPELGWFPGADALLRAYNFSYTIVDSHGLIFADPAPAKGTFGPVRTPEGLAVFSRDLYASREVWDKDSGFPADAVYRDFYRDIGYELPYEAVDCFLEPTGARSSTGFKYWAVTDRSAEKEVYDPDEAARRVVEHAQSFINARVRRGSEASALMGTAGAAICAYDAELFGHWWFEGPAFIENLFRIAARRDDILMLSPSDILDADEPLQEAVPQYSSWGANGYAETWLDSSNDWMYRHMLRSVVRMSELAERFPDDGGLKERALNQAARELLLSQASDWAFILKNNTSPDYARTRVEEHIKNFTTIYESLGGNYISTEWLTNLEKRHKLFSTINYRVFRRKHQ